jgi:hypothetical protein
MRDRTGLFYAGGAIEAIAHAGYDVVVKQLLCT